MHDNSAAVMGAGIVNSPLTRPKSLVASLTCALLVGNGRLGAMVLGGPCRLRYGDKTAEVAIDRGASYVWEGK